MTLPMLVTSSICRSAATLKVVSPASTWLLSGHLGQRRWASTTDGQQPKKKSEGFLARFMGPNAATVAEGTSPPDRWAMFLPAFATHVCLGAPYGWSAISAQLTREFGVVASSSADWVLDSCTYPMSIMVSTDNARNRHHASLLADRRWWPGGGRVRQVDDEGGYAHGHGQRWLALRLRIPRFSRGSRATQLALALRRKP